MLGSLFRIPCSTCRRTGGRWPALLLPRSVVRSRLRLIRQLGLELALKDNPLPLPADTIFRHLHSRLTRLTRLAHFFDDTSAPKRTSSCQLLSPAVVPA